MPTLKMEPGKTYHLYTHANGFENLFRSEENYRFFLKRYEHFIPAVADTLVYCLMPNHLHFLVRVKDEATLNNFLKEKITDQDQTDLDDESKQDQHTDQTGLDDESKQDLSGLVEKYTILQFSHLFNAYTKAYNKVYKRRGSLFTRAFKRKLITDDRYFSKVIHYIHRNPVHHGFVKNVEDWPWSSYQIILKSEPSFVNAEEVIQWFGRKESFERFHRTSLHEGYDLETNT